MDGVSADVGYTEEQGLSRKYANENSAWAKLIRDLLELKAPEAVQLGVAPRAVYCALNTN